jgi:hypothetical protein
MTSHHIPYKDLNTLFLDAGNTLVSMDFVWVREVLCRCGVGCEVDVLGAWSAGLHALLLDPFSDWYNVDCVRFPDLLSFATTIDALSPNPKRKASSLGIHNTK